MSLDNRIASSTVEVDREFALLCEDVVVKFPLMSPSSQWRLVFNRPLASWYVALRDVSIKVPKGKIIGVIGRNGAGKSTLLRTLAGVYQLSGGKVVALGPISSLFELGGIGGILLTGIQYIQQWLRLNQIPKSKWAEYLDDIRDFSELGDRLEDRLFTYSSGMAARLYFATATSVTCDIYLIDEVLSVGDEHFQAKCWKRIRNRLSKGVSGVLVTHDWSAVLRLCESAYELETGKVHNFGNAEKVICNYLNLSSQLDKKKDARFSNDCPQTLYADSKTDWKIEIPIVVESHSTVFFNYSIEKLVLGKDWQILILGNDTLVATEPGSYELKIIIPELPLPGGEYRLNLFLTGERPDDGGVKPTYDIRSWTSGNSIRLVVSGPRSPGLIYLPLIADK